MVYLILYIELPLVQRKRLRGMEIAEIPLPRHCERSVAIHATVVRDHGSPRFARDDETGMFVISDSLRTVKTP